MQRYSANVDQISQDSHDSDQRGDHVDIIRRLHGILAPLVNPAEEHLKHALKALQIHPCELDPYVSEPVELPYGRNVLLRTADVEVVLIHLPSGAQSLPHDHGDSYGYEIVVEGELTNLLFASKADGSLYLAKKEVYPANSLLYMPRHQIHAINNAAQQRVVTLNVYTPPLSSCRKYTRYAPSQQLLYYRTPLEFL